MHATTLGGAERLLHCRFAGRRLFVLLLDPDAQAPAEAARRAAEATLLGADLVFVGGSRLTLGSAKDTVEAVTAVNTAPVILFPGCDPPEATLVAGAAAFLCPLLLGSRDPEYLIEWHVRAAGHVRKLGIESLPTAYLLLRSERPTAAELATGFASLDAGDPERIAGYAAAGEMIGLNLVYLDAGSGAPRSVPEAVIRAVREVTGLPLIVGGGLRTPEQIRRKVESGADVVVVGNALERSWDPRLLTDMILATHTLGGPA